MPKRKSYATPYAAGKRHAGRKFVAARRRLAGNFAAIRAKDVALRGTGNQVVSPYFRSVQPWKLKVVLPYSTTLKLTKAAGTYLATEVFRANSMYDPEVAVGGHQPRGFDQLMTMYDHFTVYGCKITATFVNPVTASQLPMYAFILVTDNAAPTLPTMVDVCEYPKTTYALIHPTQGGGDNVLRNYFNIKDWFKGKSWLDASQLRGTDASDPSEEYNFVVGIGDPDQITAGTAMSDIQVQVKLEYFAILTEPHQPLIS